MKGLSIETYRPYKSNNSGLQFPAISFGNFTVLQDHQRTIGFIQYIRDDDGLVETAHGFLLHRAWRHGTGVSASTWTHANEYIQHKIEKFLPGGKSLITSDTKEWTPTSDEEATENTMHYLTDFDLGEVVEAHILGMSVREYRLMKLEERRREAEEAPPF